MATIARQGGEVQTGRRVSALRIEGGRVAAIETPDGPAELDRAEAVVLAVPPWIAPSLLPGLSAPTEFETILNVHFAVEAEPGEAGFVGLVGGVPSGSS